MTDPNTPPTTAGLRDQFAMSALSAMVNWIRPGSETGHDEAARAAYRYADAMMEARKK